MLESGSLAAPKGCQMHAFASHALHSAGCVFCWLRGGSRASFLWNVMVPASTQVPVAIVDLLLTGFIGEHNLEVRSFASSREA